MSKSNRAARKRLPRVKENGSPRKPYAEDSSTNGGQGYNVRSARSDPGRRNDTSASARADIVDALDENANNEPLIVRRLETDVSRTVEAEKLDVGDTKDVEDCNNHGCVTYSPSCATTCGTRGQLMCCSSQPNLIKVMAKLSVFLLILVSVFYSLYRVASGWNKRHEILTLLLFLLATRMVCKKNWFLPSQYWRNLDPCCDQVPRQVDVTVPSRCV
ncbi:hypothetical protein ElyMa_005882500 [Elysia marginata]|uniref:WAP domain-containing protein n=1 Tax=Elysia marginata TaxID=1093978 RepID=A0AAV4G1X5_9GAST|nr:hypothetical protein ElyMa_005882500 [Elysia marginata]